jgi:hypothetical protein
MSSYAEALLEFYGGEVGGEAAYSSLLGMAENDEQRLKWATLLQLETETKAWLRAPLIAHGVSIEERDADRARAARGTEGFRQMSWSQKMQALSSFLEKKVVPRYQSLADEARARGSADEVAVCVFMVEHEKAQIEFAQRELAGASADRSLEPVVKFLKYPIKS